MTAQTDDEIGKAGRPTTEQRVILYNVGWVTYEHLLAGFSDQSSPRITYDQGTLEIMTPLPDHERANRTIASIIDVLAEELILDVLDLGSTTFKREDLQRGFEPDSCFYFQNAAQMRSKKEIDLTVDPPPEIVVEVDIKSVSLNKLPIYAKIGVPEIWRYDGEKITIYKLSVENYIEIDNSIVFPFVSGNDISSFLEKSETLTRPAFLKSLREWIRKHRTQQ